ncbi:hypothetical protein MN032_10985 [Agromyces atrinae]|uniref:hypothetical protein n=1 Tax=Agromyces atrinae TaxID=592376 RepID=UPI001F58AD4E|nr:hypothetical protein [Agromyces atrinae]MCI2958222.1 hypothetical protein [Agromyces atrinae]
MSAHDCRGRLGDVQCQRPYPHDGPHRAETDAPKTVEGGLSVAQVLTWEDQR